MDATKQEILGLYDEDFYKIDPTGKAASLFKAIPAQLAGNAHRYQITPVIGEVEDTALLTLLHRWSRYIWLRSYRPINALNSFPKSSFFVNLPAQSG